MLAVALVLASVASPVGPAHTLRLVSTESTQVTYIVRDRGPQSVSELIAPLHEFSLRGRYEVDPEGWDQAMRMLSDDPAAKRGMAHAMSRATWSTMQPTPYTVPGLQVGQGQIVDRAFGLRRFDLTIQNGAEPVTVGRYWMPEPQPLGEALVMTSGIRLPGGFESTWSYRDGGWRRDTPSGPVETTGAPSQLEVERSGIDLNRVQYVIRNRTDEPVSGSVLPGEVLVPEDGATQRMMTTDRVAFTVPPGGTATVEVPVVCLDIGKKQPSPADRFLPPFRAPSSATSFAQRQAIANLANLTAFSPVLGPWDQARTWIQASGASMEEVNARLGTGVFPLMYQRAVAEVAMHGGWGPDGAVNESILKSLAAPRSMLMGMAEQPDRTSLLAANLGSSGGTALIRQGAQGMLQQLRGLTPSEPQLVSLAETCSTLLWSGDTPLMKQGIEMARTLDAGAKGFAARPNVRRALEFAGCSPVTEIRSLASALAPQSGSEPTLFALSHCLRQAEELVRDTFAASCPAPPPTAGAEDPRGFGVSFTELPMVVSPNEAVALGLAATGGQTLATSFGFQTSPVDPVRAIATEGAALQTGWVPPTAGPAVVNFVASVVSTDGQIARTSIPVYVGTVATLRSDLADALRRAREARAREARARAEAARMRAAYEEAVRTLREHLSDLQTLQCADRDLLDDLEGIYRVPISDLVKRNEALGGGAPPVAGNVDKAAEEAQKAADDCMKELEELRNQKADAEQKRDELHDEIQDILDDVRSIYEGAGFTGGDGFHAGGTGWFGWVGEGKGLPPAQERQVSELQRQLRAKNRATRDANQQIEDLEAKIRAKEEECAELAKRNAEAQQAKANKDEIAANDAQIGKAWDDLSGRLQELADKLREVEGGAGLAGEAEGLAGAVPRTAAEWDRFWERLNALIERKLQLEEQLARKVVDDKKKASDLRNGASQAEGAASDAAGEATGATNEAGAIQDEIDRQKAAAAAAGTPPPSPTAPAEDPCMKKFAAWLAKYQDKMSQSQLDKLKEMMKSAAETAQVPGVALGDAIAGGAKALASGAGNAAVGLNALASGFLSLGAGLFYAYAQSEIARALGPLGSKIRLARIAALLLGSREKCGEVGEGGVTGTGTESFFYFRVGDKLIVFRGGEGGVEFVGAGPG